MANLYNILGTASTVGGLLSNALSKKNKGKAGAYADWAKAIPQHLKDYGVQRDNLGMIACPVPKVMRERYANNNDKIYGVTRRSESFNVPGTTIPVSEVRRYGFGPNVKVPIGTVNHTNLTVQLLADQMGLYYQWMIAWMNGIVTYNGRKSMNSPDKWGNYFYEVNYFKNYAVDLTIYELDEKYDAIIETTYAEAYPISISDKQINWGNSGLVTFNVEFVYTNLEVKLTQLDRKGMLPPPPSARKPSPLGSIMKGLSIAQAVTSMRGKGNIGTAAGLVAAGAATLGTIRR